MDQNKRPKEFKFRWYYFPATLFLTFQLDLNDF